MNNQIIFDTSRMSIGKDGGINNFYWPLAKSEAESFRNKLLAGFAEVSRLKGDDLDLERDLFSTINQLMVREALALFQVYVLIRRSKASGLETLWPVNSDYFSNINKGSTPQIKDSINVKTLMKGPSCHTAWKRPLVKLRRDIKFNGISWGSLRRTNAKKDIVACHITQVMEEHARVASDTIKYTLFGEWFTALNDKLINEYSPKPLDSSICENVMTVFTNAFSIGGEALPQNIYDYFHDVLIECSKLARIHLDKVLEKPEILPKRLWTGTGGYIWCRILRHAVRRVGGEVTGHEHGTGEGIIKYFNTKTFTDYESANNFVTFNSNQCRWLKEILDEQYLIPIEKPNICIPEYKSGTVKYAGSQLITKKTDNPGNGKIKKIMYVASIYTGDKPRPFHHNADIVIVDWQIRLLSHLKQWGYQVLFKAHPEGEQRPPPIFFDELGAESIPGRFEEVWNQADLFMFDWKSTTAFSTAMKTDTPTMLIDFGFEEFMPEVKALVKKRCMLIEGNIDSNNRLQIDWDDMKNNLSNPKTGDNREFLEAAFRFK